MFICYYYCYVCSVLGIVLLCCSVYCLCVTVLYYCHRVSTQLQLTNISYRIISYHIQYHIVSYRISYHITYHITYHIISHIISIFEENGVKAIVSVVNSVQTRNDGNGGDCDESSIIYSK